MTSIKGNTTIKKYNGSLTVSVRSDGNVYLSISDDGAAVGITEIVLDHASFLRGIGGLACIPCVGTFYDTGKVGMLHENKDFEFPLPEECSCTDKDRKEIAAKSLEAHVPDGWVGDAYFEAQHSFFEQGGKPWARATIRRWTEKEDSQ